MHKRDNSLKKPLRIMFWGTYDLGKPRTRILLNGLKRVRGIEVFECHCSIWETTRDKGDVNILVLVRRLVYSLLSYPMLIRTFMATKNLDAVVIGYLGQLDVLIIYLFARFRNIPIIWDQFISIYDTLVLDRSRFSRLHPVALLLYCWEWLACRAADCILMDTDTHAAYITRLFNVSANRIKSLWVGAETDFFQAKKIRPKKEILTAIFYGQFIPLHGIETIIKASQLMKLDQFRFIVIGQGQEQDKIRILIEECKRDNLTWIPWVPYQELNRLICKADVCLGIFGTTAKASRVIPNKVFQAISARRPIVTRDSPAIRELWPSPPAGVLLVPPGNPEALADALKTMKVILDQLPRTGLYQGLVDRITPDAIGEGLKRIIEEVCNGYKYSGRE